MIELQNSLLADTEASPEVAEAEDVTDERPVSFKAMFCNGRFMMACLSVSLALTVFGF